MRWVAQTIKFKSQLKCKLISCTFQIILSGNQKQK